MKRIVLCRPEGPRNLGSIVRAVTNLGPAEIVLVSPQRPSLLVHPDFEQMSHGAEAARASIRVVGDLGAALADCAWAVGFTARARFKRERVDWRALAPECAELADHASERIAFVFGSESLGLTSEETDLCQVLAHLRTAEEHTSLNLAMAVTIVLWSVFGGTRVHAPERGSKPLADQGRRFLVARLEEVFADRVARTPAASDAIRRSIRRVFARAPLEDRDARAWHLMLRALGSQMSPKDLGLELNEKGGRRRDELDRHRRGEDPRAGPGPGQSFEPRER